MANNTKLPWPLSIERQWGGPLEVDRLVNNLDELKALESKASNYCTMIVGCKSNGLLYKFNTTTNEFESLNIVPDAVNDNEATNLGQVKKMISKYNKDPVIAATTENLDGVYTDNTLTLTKELLELDGIFIHPGDSILVKNQDDKTINGIYVIQSNQKTLLRRDDFLKGDVITNNITISVMDGTKNKDTKWNLISDNKIIVDSSDLVFERDTVDASTIYWTGTSEQFEKDKAAGLIKPGMIVYITNDSSNFDSQDIYDTYEVETNKCFLGKTVYRKLFEIPSMLANSSKGFYVKGLDRVILLSGTFRSSNKDYSVNYSSTDGIGYNTKCYYSKTSLTDGYIYFYTGANISVDSGYIIAEYTKD